MIDPSNGYRAAVMAKAQRPVVEAQLKAMRAGNPPDEFRFLGGAVAWLRDNDSPDLMSLLDAGCASAYYYEVLEYYVPGWIEYTGFDYNAEAVAMAKDIYPSLSIYTGDILDMRFRDRRFDMVLAGAVVNHIREWHTALAQLTRVCRRWLILHRLPVHAGETQIGKTEAYGEQVWDIVFNEHELAFWIAQLGFERIWLQEWSDQTTQIWQRISPESSPNG